MTNLTAIAIAALLIVIGGLLVAFETALGRISFARVEELEDDGVSSAARLKRVLADRVKYVTVLLFVRQACSVVAIVLVANEFAKM